MTFLAPLPPKNTLYTCIEMAGAIISLPIVLWPKIILTTTNRIDGSNNEEDDPHKTPPTSSL
jgi:hypothetical protein